MRRWGLRKVSVRMRNEYPKCRTLNRRGVFVGSETSSLQSFAELICGYKMSSSKFDRHFTTLCISKRRYLFSRKTRRFLKPERTEGYKVDITGLAISSKYSIPWKWQRVSVHVMTAINFRSEEPDAFRKATERRSDSPPSCNLRETHLGGDGEPLSILELSYDSFKSITVFTATSFHAFDTNCTVTQWTRDSSAKC